jgi:DNA-binding transcriptional LysR family regulator
MDRLDLIQTFVRVVEFGSFSAAARELGLKAASGIATSIM